MGKKVEAWAILCDGKVRFISPLKPPTAELERYSNETLAKWERVRLVPASSEAEVRELRKMRSDVRLALVRVSVGLDGEDYDPAGTIGRDLFVRLSKSLQRSLKPRNKKGKR